MPIKILDPGLYEEEARAGSFSGKHPGDAGVDLRSTIDVKVHAGETVKIPLGVAVQAPPGHFGLIEGRSSAALEHGLFTHAGVVDSGYRGEVHALVTAQGSPVEIRRGERIAQLIIVQIYAPPLKVVDELPPSVRGDDGLGSTGRM